MSVSGRLQSADATLFVTGPGLAPEKLLEMGRTRRGVSAVIKRTNNTILEAIPKVWPRLLYLKTFGEQWQCTYILLI